MFKSITIYIITTIIGMIMGYAIRALSKIKNQEKAIRGILKADMTEVYYQYEATKRIPFFIKEAWNGNYDTYTAMGGNSFIVTLKKEIDTWEVIK